MTGAWSVRMPPRHLAPPPVERRPGAARRRRFDRMDRRSTRTDLLTRRTLQALALWRSRGLNGIT